MDLSNKHITLNVQYIPDNPNDISINPFLVKGIIVNEIVPFNDSQKIFHLKLQTKIKGKTAESIKYKNITHVYVIMNIFDLDNFQNRQDVFCMLGFFSSQEPSRKFNTVSSFDKIITDSAKITLH